MTEMRVAIVDDEELARKLVREYLSGIEDMEIVAECANGFEAVKSVMEPAGSGTRNDVPSRCPFMAASTRPVARAAPVPVGTMLFAAARARRRSLCGRSRRFWSLV